jgi:uncharacterized protein YfeS
LVRRLLSEREIPDLGMSDPPVTGREWSNTTDGIAFNLNNEAYIAAAIAAIKLRGFCDVESKDLALAALAREESVASKLVEAKGLNIDEAMKRFQQMTAVLRGIPLSPSAK